MAHTAIKSLAVLVPLLLASPVRADDPELAFMPRTMQVTLLNQGGKYVAIDMKHIDQGGMCRMDKDATIVKVGPGRTDGTVLVRFAAPQLSPGGCPFLTEFELSNEDYAAARKVFLDAKESAEKKVQQIKDELREKWNEVIGKTGQ